MSTEKHTPEPEKWNPSSDHGWDCVRDEYGAVICLIKLNVSGQASRICNAYNATYASGINPEGIKDAVDFIRKIVKPQEDSDLWLCSREDDLSDFEPDSDAMKEATRILAKLEGAQG